MFQDKLSQTKIIKTIEIPSSTWYLHKTSVKVDGRHSNKGHPRSNTSISVNGEVIPDSIVIEALRNLRARPLFHNGGGYRKMTKYLKRVYGYHLNKKKVYRLCRENGLLLPPRNKKGSRRTPISVNRVVSAPFQLWELDVKYGFIHGENRFFFVMAIIDVYLRFIVGYHIGLRCLGSDLVRTLRLAMNKMNIPETNSLVIRMDNGPQMKSNAMFKFAEENSNKLIHELIPIQTPNKDAHIESFYSILEMECFRVNLFRTYSEAYQVTSEFIQQYQSIRIHGSLKDRTPMECLSLFKTGNLTGIKSIRL